ncbi:MAG: FAD:protein FMN transferase [Firmicutes bacterium]|nr:FAD:protein FMN transferase [Alicyclobacillaceae bacterium]MCL6496840.1 FAD:protein FMN transferase [Bacillota bacterium]
MSPESETQSLLTPAGFTRITFGAMGSTVEAVVPASSEPRALGVLREVFGGFEAVLSRFDPQSALSRVNHGPGHWHRVPPLLGWAVTQALAAAEATGGLFDPTVGGVLVALGYDRPFAALTDPLPAPSPQARAATVWGTWRTVMVDRGGARLFLPPKTTLDLGGIGKGLAVDEALRRLTAQGATPALVSAGGDLAVAGTPPGLSGWVVALPQGQRLVLRQGAIATSGPQHRRWRQGDRWRHHLIDPRAGTCATSDLVWCSVVAPRCAEADVAATVAWILGAAAGAAFLQARRLGGVLALADGSVQWIGLPEPPEEAMRHAVVG